MKCTMLTISAYGPKWWKTPDQIISRFENTFCLLTKCYYKPWYREITGNRQSKHFPRNWPFVRGIHRSPVNSQHKGQGCGTLMFSLIRAWINRWVNNGEAGDLRRIRPHYDVTVMGDKHFCCTYIWNRPHSPLGLSMMALMPTLFPCNTQDPLSLGLGRQFSTIRYIWPISFVIVNCVYGCKYKQNNFNWDESTLIQMRLYVNN